MDVFLTGATGFVGSALLARLVDAGHRVRCLVRPRSRRRFDRAAEQSGDAVVPVAGDCFDMSSLSEAMRGCPVVIHLVGIIREFPRKGVTFERLHVEATQNMIHAAVRNGVDRFLLMSALGARDNAPARYHRTKFLAEQFLIRSGVPYVIFRPSIIFGPGDEFVNRLSRMMIPLLPVPVIGNGQGRIQPVAIENVVDGFERALAPPGCLNRVYEAGGPRAYSMLEILEAIGRVKGRRRLRTIRLPLNWLQKIVPRFEHWRLFPLTSDQLIMLQEDNICDPHDFIHTFALEPVDFEAGIMRYLGRQQRGRK